MSVAVGVILYFCDNEHRCDFQFSFLSRQYDEGEENIGQLRHHDEYDLIPKELLTGDEMKITGIPNHKIQFWICLDMCQNRFLGQLAVPEAPDELALQCHKGQPRVVSSEAFPLKPLNTPLLAVDAQRLILRVNLQCYIDVIDG